jgi:pyruvate dehydrogenase E2 component (dihydrolipoamide acetyltransferase)
MAEAVLMPRQGQSVESCILTGWYKKEGDTVKKGEILFSYETDKASFEEAAPIDGILLATFFKEGDEIPVLTNVAVIGEANESISDLKPGTLSDEKKEEIPDITEEKLPETAEIKINKSEAKNISTDNKELFLSPRARWKAEKLGVVIDSIKGTGPRGRVIERDIDKAAKSGKLLTSLAKEIAEKEKISAGTSGSGIGGRITADDLLNPKNTFGGDFEITPLTNIRKLIAENMHASLQNSAQLTHHMSADVRRLLKWRKKFKEDSSKTNTSNITINDMVCFAVIKALKNKPGINAHFLGDSIRRYNKVHLGLAVDTERGLMVPTLRNADDYNIYRLSSQLRQLAESCKTGKIDPDLLTPTAASFTVSNLGSFGVEMFTPVINLPQCGILGVNTIINRPADLGDGVIGFVPFIGLSLTYDHRALDGAPASDFLREVKNQIENLDLKSGE